jgi:hypothetical protein
MAFLLGVGLPNVIKLREKVVLKERKRAAGVPLGSPQHFKALILNLMTLISTLRRV